MLRRLVSFKTLLIHSASINDEVIFKDNQPSTLEIITYMFSSLIHNNPMPSPLCTELLVPKFARNGLLLLHQGSGTHLRI